MGYKLNEIDQLTEFQYDALREIANIGFGNAATSLSKLVNNEVSINIPALKMQLIEKVPGIVGGEESLVYGIMMQIYGDLNGYIMMLLPAESVKSISSILLNYENDDLLSEMNMSMMQEVGHILGGTYVSSLSDFFNMNISVSPPYATYDMAAAIIDLALIEMSRDLEYALVFDSEMMVKDNIINGKIFTMFDTASLDQIMSRIDKMVL